jgi:hypothetical protein
LEHSLAIPYDQPNSINPLEQLSHISWQFPDSEI